MANALATRGDTPGPFELTIRSLPDGGYVVYEPAPPHLCSAELMGCTDISEALKYVRAKLAQD